MAQGKKTNTATRTSVIEAKLRNPDMSLRDLQKETDLNYVTCWDILKETPELLTGSNVGERIIANMDEIVSDIIEITRLAVKPIKDKVNDWTLSINDIKSLNEIARNNFDRSQLLKGKATANVKVSGFKEYSTEELLKQLEE